jgi:hypothetical protein
VLHAGLTGSGKWPTRLQALPDIPSRSGVGAQGPDHLTFDLADASKLSLSFYGKRPGPGMRLDKLSMQQLIAPHAWRLPFERAWRNPNPVGS